MFRDYYKILGISKAASAEEVKAAYRNLSLKWHPDKNIGRDVTSIMQDINEAYAILRNPDSRKRYDAEYELYERSREKAQKVNTTSSHTHTSYEDSYDIHDEKVKEDIASAREYARKLVKEFLSSIKKDSKKAANGAWDGAKGYLLAAVILFLLSLFIKTCSQASREKPYTRIEIIDK